MKIFIIRHGQTTANIGQANGELEANIPLTQTGIEQCITAGKDLKKYCEENNIDLSKAKIIFSPYLRTQNTAEYIAKEIGVNDLTPSHYITERDFGKFATNEYALWEEIDSVENQKYLQSLNSPYSSFYHRLPNGESVQDCYLRAKNVTDELKSHKDTDSVFILVCHRITAKCLLMNFIDEDIFWYHKTKDVPNCSIICVENTGNEFSYKFADGYKLIEE